MPRQPRPSQPRGRRPEPPAPPSGTTWRARWQNTGRHTDYAGSWQVWYCELCRQTEWISANASRPHRDAVLFLHRMAECIPDPR